ncbi:hypothetical protein JMJ56_30170 [Belnapia sp. T18]|uniref:Uncharacterized protein n=1 Tax=Belnapia arida TaxID=2804533 RepID=A0ABS1UC40_9PROT|nr:hypothetical protein [Belnapia arida]MBL6082246.1 hypothetical protein [Belnapia arida]
MSFLSNLLHPAGFARGNLAPFPPIEAIDRLATGGPVAAGCIPMAQEPPIPLSLNPKIQEDF